MWLLCLFTVIFASFLSYFDKEKIKVFITISFSLLACFVPELTFYFPLIAYDMIYCRFQMLNIIGVIPLLIFFKSSDWRTSLLVMTVLLISVVLKSRSTEQLRLKARYNNLIDDAREMSIRLKKQNKELIEKQDFELANAMLNERNRIAREIHDSVGHILSSAILQSGALMTINRDEKVKELLINLKDTLNLAMDSIRASVHQLYDESVDLRSKIIEITNSFTFCEMNLDYQINGNPDKKIKYLFISVIKEALSNVIKHSDANRVSIILREHPALYQLIIRDNGSVQKFSTEDGIGLKNMKDRVESLNGNINILTNNGFEIFISVPKTE
jgi:signal transduction histidine kinase